MTKERWFSVSRVVSIGVCSLLCACGAPAAQSALSASGSVAAGAAGELSELGSFQDHGVPNGVVIWLRIPAAGRDVPLLGTLIGVGSMIDPAALLDSKLGASLSRTVDLSKPVDMTVSGFGDAPVRLALAAGIVDANTFVSQVRGDFQVLHEAPGRWRIIPKAKTGPDELVCELWHAAAPVGARLICGSDGALIQQQGEFFMAAARTSVDGANFHAEVPGSAAQLALQKGAEEEAQKSAKSAKDDDRAASDGRALGLKLVTDFGRDIEGISWDLSLRRDLVEMSQVIAFAHSDSLVTATLSGRSGPQKAVPEAFWRLPSDSLVALYSEGAEPEPMRRLAASWIHELRTTVDAAGEDEMPAAVLDHMEQVFRDLVMRGGGFELAYGRDLDRAADALNEAADHAKESGPRSGSADPALKKAEAQLGGWILFGIEDDSKAYLSTLHEAIRVAMDKTKYPRKKQPKSSAPSSTNQYFNELPLPASAGLPSEALHVVVRSEPNPKYVASKGMDPAPPPSKFHLIAVPDAAQHLWLAFSSDEALALARARAALSADPEKTVGASAELRQLAKGPSAGIGYLTLAGLNALDLSAESKAKVLESRETLKSLRMLPKRGNTHVPISITRTQSAKGGRRIAVNLQLTPDALGDVLAAFIAQAADSGSDDEE